MHSANERKNIAHFNAMAAEFRQEVVKNEILILFQAPLSYDTNVFLISKSRVRHFFCGTLHHNFAPYTITHQPTEVEGCSNPLKMREV